jgi:serine/threonine protein kinase
VHDPAGLRIIDFGLAGIMGPGDSSQVSGLRGSLTYVAPEVLRGATISARTDLYALGALLYHMAAGRPAFEGSPAAVIQQHLDAVPTPLDHVRAEIPAGLVTMVRHLLAKDPSHRYASTWDALADLEGTAPSMSRPCVEAPLLGRDVALARLERLVRPRADARVVAIIGEDGAGRSRLLEAFRWRLELGHRMDVVEIGLSSGATDPLASARELLSKLALLSGREPPDPCHAPFRLEGGPVASDSLGSWHAMASFGVEALATGPSVLLLDDLHRASEPVFEAIRSLALALDEAQALPPPRRHQPSVRRRGTPPVRGGPVRTRGDRRA